MVFNKRKQGQAAIEFLMTYGWMLLVVLIVGALIFSFVDFGSLLPNRIELNNNLRASATESSAYGDDSGSTPDDLEDSENVIIVFTYNGASRVEISKNAGKIFPSVGVDCNSTRIKNVDISHEDNPDKLTFLNGQTGIMFFECPERQLITGDVVEGTIQIQVTSTKTGLSTPSTGPIRLGIN